MSHNLPPQPSSEQSTPDARGDIVDDLNFAPGDFYRSDGNYPVAGESATTFDLPTDQPSQNLQS